MFQAFGKTLNRKITQNRKPKKKIITNIITTRNVSYAVVIATDFMTAKRNRPIVSAGLDVYIVYYDGFYCRLSSLLNVA